MSTREVRLEDFSKILDQFSKLSIKKKKQAIADGLARSLSDLAVMSPKDTGLYASSWDLILEEKKAIIGNYAPYAAIIEYGARPHTPPIRPLLAWAKRVLKSSSQPPEYEPKVWALAKYTQKKIEMYGQAPKHVMEKAIPMIIENVRQELKRAAR